MRFISLVLFVLISVLPVSGESVKILALGDSLFAGYGLEKPSEESFPAQLRKSLIADGLEIEIINAGVSGDTTSGGVDRLEWSLFDQPDLVLLELGANDALRGLPLEDVETNLRQMINVIRKREMGILFIGMKASPSMGLEYQQKFDAIFPALAEELELPFYPFFLEGVAADPELNQADGLHPTSEGVALIVENIKPLVAEVIETLR